MSVLVGRAGTGKGVTIAAAARAWQLEGNEVIGTAIAGVVAQRLKDDAKLDRSYTTDGLLTGIENGHIRSDSNTVVVMDEAGMSRQRPPLPPHPGDRRARKQAPARRRRRAALPNRRGRPVQRDREQGPHRRTHRSPPRQPRVGAQRLAANPRRRTRPRARAIQGPRPPAHPRHPRPSRGGDGRELGPNTREPHRTGRR